MTELIKFYQFLFQKSSVKNDDSFLSYNKNNFKRLVIV